jgi:putative transposase
VDQDDNVLDMLVQSRRNKQAAKKFFRKLFKGLQYVSRVIITDRLQSYGAAKREYRMQGFMSAGHAQRFLSAYGPIAHHFHPRRYLLSASVYREAMKNRFESWADITGTKRAA